jgi:aryl-alcohol dehydrogenase-like predicted oxidoreductase
MSAAYDAGVTYFDVARSYGYGDAEAILGRFIRDKRDRVIVASKFGIEPPKRSLVRRIAMAAGRRVFAIAPGLRSMAAPALGTQAVARRFDTNQMKRSVETTLRQLATDRVDVLLIHDCTPDALEDDELFRALEELVTSGKVACIGASGERATAAHGLRRRPSLRVVQFRHELIGPHRAPPLGSESVATVVHHPFGGEAGVARLKEVVARASRDSSAPEGLGRRLRLLPEDEAIASIAFSSAWRFDRASVVLTAMFTPRHIEANARASSSVGQYSETEWSYLERLLREA